MNEYVADAPVTVLIQNIRERRSRRFARLIVERRATRPFERSEDLVDVLERVIPRATMQDRARIFQALRIAVNDELSLLERAGFAGLRAMLLEQGEHEVPGTVTPAALDHGVERLEPLPSLDVRIARRRVRSQFVRLTVGAVAAATPLARPGGTRVSRACGFMARARMVRRSRLRLLAGGL